MAVKTQSGVLPKILGNQHYSGMMTTLLYNWPIFVAGLLFGIGFVGAGFLIPSPWHWFFVLSGLGVMGLLISILATVYYVYDWGTQRDFERLAELGHISEADMVVDITCGKLRGTRGLLSIFNGGHYFLLDLFDASKMTDKALLRARDLEPPLTTKRRIYKRTGQPDRLPLPHNWADTVVCHLSLHELHDSNDRVAVLKECARLLKPKGRLLIAEHDRDWRNFLAFGPGAWSFFSAKNWQQQFEEAGLKITHHEKWRGLVNLWTLERKPRKSMGIRF